MNIKLYDKANYWLNNAFGFEEEMIVLKDSNKEHKHCYSSSWCKLSEMNLPRSERTQWIGIGKLMISKNGERAELQGSFPGIDWVYHFENKLLNHEYY